MYALILLVAMAVLVYRSSFQTHDVVVIPRNISNKLTKLWEIAHLGMRENSLQRAEKALLTILNIDTKNAAAYNRLGILYAKQKEFKDAIDCFKIASSLDPTPSSLHNLGLIYYETENFDQAATAFEHALKLEDGLAARHIAYAKVQEKLGNQKLMIQELERAAELEPNSETYSLLVSAYNANGQENLAQDFSKKLNRMAPPQSKQKVIRAKRVVI